MSSAPVPAGVNRRTFVETLSAGLARTRHAPMPSRTALVPVPARARIRRGGEA